MAGGRMKVNDAASKYLSKYHTSDLPMQTADRY